jgi:hypothetical protein
VLVKEVDQLSSRTNPDSSFGCFRQRYVIPWKRRSTYKDKGRDIAQDV